MRGVLLFEKSLKISAVARKASAIEDPNSLFLRFTILVHLDYRYDTQISLGTVCELKAALAALHELEVVRGQDKLRLLPFGELQVLLAKLVSFVLSFRSRHDVGNFDLAYEQHLLKHKIDTFLMHLDARNLRNLRRLTRARVTVEERKANDHARKTVRSAALQAAQKRRALLHWDPHETLEDTKCRLAQLKKN